MIVLVGWGLLLAAFAAVELLFNPRSSELALLGGTGLACLFVGLVLGALHVSAPAARRVVRWPDRSFSTVLASVGFAVAVLGAELGLWCVLIGAGVFAIGAGGLIREWRAERG